MIKDTENGATHFADDATLAYIAKLEAELVALKATSAEPVALSAVESNWKVTSDHYRSLMERHLEESRHYQALLYHAWQTIRSQQKGLKRQSRKIKRLLSVPHEAQLKAAQREVLEKVHNDLEQDEFFEDGLSADLHDAGIETLSKAYMQGREDLLIDLQRMIDKL